jgi:hypothetical protein
VEILCVGEEALALRRERVEPEAEALVQVAVRAPAELGGCSVRSLEHLSVVGVELRGELHARPLELFATRAVGLVGDRRKQIAVADRAAADIRLQGRLELGDALLVGRVEVPEQAFAGEAPELDDASAVGAPVDELAQLAARRR